jgi:fructokinase
MNDSDLSPIHGRPVIFGEVLFDIFPDGREVLGGAPFNVARHLQGFGCEPLFVSRVGDDERGQQVREAMREWGMDLAGLQLDPAHPTGTVQIAMRGYSHTFDILPDQAYDYIEAEAALSLLQQGHFELLYFGSLIERSPISRATLEQLRALRLPQFVDINLRAPWWQQERVCQLIHGVDWLKLNDEELRELGYRDYVTDAVATLFAEYSLNTLVVTCGERGAMIVNEDGITKGAPVAVEKMVDTVGAGDAFSAVCILGLLRGWEWPRTLQHALGFAARLCEVRGAVLPDRAWYSSALSGWGKE